MNEDIKHWIEIAKYDLKTAEAMFDSARYLYVLFCSQQAIEKVLKALFIKQKNEMPPKIHNLLKLVQLTDITIDQEKELFIRKLNNYYIETRYPDEMIEIARSVTKELAGEYLKKTKETFSWLEQLVK